MTALSVRFQLELLHPLPVLHVLPGRTMIKLDPLLRARAWRAQRVRTVWLAAALQMVAGFAQRAATRLLEVVPVRFAPYALLGHSLSHRGHPYAFLAQPVSSAQRELLSTVRVHAGPVVFLPPVLVSPVLARPAHQDFMRNHLLHPRVLRVLRGHFHR